MRAEYTFAKFRMTYCLSDKKLCRTSKKFYWVTIWKEESYCNDIDGVQFQRVPDWWVFKNVYFDNSFFQLFDIPFTKAHQCYLNTSALICFAFFLSCHFFVILLENRCALSCGKWVAIQLNAVECPIVGIVYSSFSSTRAFCTTVLQVKDKIVG